MTAANTGPEKHCGHECGGTCCPVYALGQKLYPKAQRGFPCNISKCGNDTRQRKVPEGAQMYAIGDDELERIMVEHDIPTLRLVRSRPLSCNIMTCPGATDMCMERNGAQGQQPDCNNCRKVYLLEQNVEGLMDMLKKQAQPQDAGNPDYCKHLRWNSQIEGNGDYRCELGNKTSCEWCETLGKPSRCGDYCSASPNKSPICDKCKSGTGPFCKGCHTLHQLPQYSPWPELRMIEALEHVASTESWTAMNAYIAECRKQAEERAKAMKG